ncbi:MAG: iron complex outermembrane receptor protein [Cellvibrionaceae bacterium]|jgi:iron complex outermembrane receptor protein
MKKIILPFCALLASAQLVFAEDDVTQIIISATGSEESEVLAPVSLSVITQKDIQLSGANTLTEVLRKQAGIQIKDKIGGGNRASISLRGFGENSVNNVLIVVDGRKLNNPSIEAPLLTSVSLKDIERIEVIQGSGGVLYGDQAVGGVINIITKKFQKEQLYVSTTQGTHDLETYKIGASQTFDNGIAYRLSGEKRQSDNYRDNNESDYGNVFAEIGYDTTWGNINYEKTHVEDNLNLPGSLSFDQIAENRRQTNTPNNYSNNIIDIDSLTSSLFVNENIKLNTDISLRDGKGEYSFGTPTSQNTKVRIISSKVIGDWVLPQGNINFIGGYEDITSDYNSGSFTDIENTQESLYAQLSYPIVNGLHIVGGARRTENKDKNFINNNKNNDSLTATEIGLNYRTSMGRLFVRRAEAFRFANADEYTFAALDPGTDFLKPQESTSYEAGYEYNKNNTLVNVLIYDLTIDDEIYYEPSDGTGRGKNVNLEETNRQGILVELGMGLNPAINIGGSLGYSKAELRAGSFNGNEVGGTNRESVSAFVGYKLKQNVNLYLDAIYTGSRFASGDEANKLDKQPSYTLVNFSASWAAGPLDFGLRINNLNDKKYLAYYSEFGRFPASERTIEFTLAYDIL